MIKQKLNYLFIIAVYFMTTIVAFAQDEIPDEEGPEGPPPASINRYIVFLVFLGMALAWAAFKKLAKPQPIETEQSNT